MKDKKHIIIMFSLIAGFLIFFQLIASQLKPDSFDKFGHYRWDALKDIQSQKSVNQSIDACADCHQQIYKLHKKDAHYNVPCVDCHGAGDLHVSFHNGGQAAAGISFTQAELKKEYNLEGCLYCHRKLAARPSDFPQVDQEEHFKFLHVTDPDTKCTDCHNPHEPLFLVTEVSQSRLHPIVYRCGDCHSEPKEGDYSHVKDHPKIFDCKDCHSEIVADFIKSPHNNHVDCRTCHLFHKESETIGRIYKNGNARFCLMCHETESFKSQDYPPKIEWPEHIANLGYGIETDEKICLDCHSGQIHKMHIKREKSPHQQNWNKEHAKFAMNKSTNNVNSTCGTCHKQEDNFCISCHKLELPHSEDFTMFHSETVSKKGKSLCYSCHTKDNCSACHDAP